MDYIIYRDNERVYTLILSDNRVYTFDEYYHVMMEDGELNMNTPYPHLGEVVSIDNIKKKGVREFVKTLISI